MASRENSVWGTLNSDMENVNINNLESMQIATEGGVESILEKVDWAIKIKDLETLIKPAAINFGQIESRLVVEYKFFQCDKRRDDEFLITEQRELDCPPPTQIIIQPWETSQQEACNDFSAPVIDKSAPIDKMKKPA